MASEEFLFKKKKNYEKGHSLLFTHSVAERINLVPLHANSERAL